MDRRSFLIGSALLLGQATLGPPLLFASPRKKVLLAWDPQHFLHHQAGHPENAQRLKSVHDLLAKDELWSGCDIRILTKISEEILLRGHTPAYVKRIREDVSSRYAGYFETDKWSAYAGKHTYEVAARASTGLAELALEIFDGRVAKGFALLRPPGHHAGSARAEGFCVFNHVALAALHIIANSTAEKKIAIVDLDAHHGNGIQEITQHSAKIIYISAHQKDWFPYQGNIEETGLGAGKGNTMNIPLPPHTGDKGYARLMEQLIFPKLKKFKPDFLMVCAGYDAHWRDYMAGLGLSLTGFRDIHQGLIQFADQNCGGKILFSLEGGYHLPALSQGVANTVSALQGRDYFRDPLGPSPYPEPDLSSLIEQARKIHSL